MSDDRSPMPDASEFKQMCAERGGTCVTREMAEQHDYNGTSESYRESITCGTNAVADPNATGSYANANSSGYLYTEVRR